MLDHWDQWIHLVKAALSFINMFLCHTCQGASWHLSLHFFKVYLCPNYFKTAVLEKGDSDDMKKLFQNTLVL